MAQIRDGSVAVLEVITLQERLRIVGSDPLQRLRNAIRRPAIAGQRVRTFFRRERSYGDDSFQPRYDSELRIPIRRLSELAQLPEYAHGPKEDAGLDLRSIEAVSLQPGIPTLVPTGLAIELPPGYEAQIRPRSGLALKHSITIPNSPATIDPGYRGEIRVILLNLGSTPYRIEPGDRIAQMVVAKYEAVEWEEAELSDSVRGTGGFGSSGR